MQDGSQKPRHKLYGGIAASVALHVIIAVALFVRLPAAEMQPPQEESVSVEIVPPPEEPPAEEKPAEQEQALNLTMPEQKPEEQKPEEQEPPPPEPTQQPAEEAKAEPPPPPPAPEEKAEAEQPPPEEVPPPAEGPPPEEQAAEPPPQQQLEPATESADQNNEQQEANGRPLPVLRPVFEFGEDSKGSGVSPDGNAAEEGEVAKAADRDPEIPSEEAEETGEAEPSEAEPAAETSAEAETAAPALPQDVAPPTLETANANPLATSDDGTIEGILADIAAEPVERPPAEKKPVEDKASNDKPMTEAKRLFSQTDTSDASATTAMGNIPRGVRASQLCTTELREQLRHGSPAYQPEILPSYSLPKGNVLDIRSAAFRAGAQWYDLRFRCEIDDGATKVVSFGLEVGGAVPRSQWKARRFPEF